MTECHGTGTALGDPVEMHSLCDARMQSSDPNHVHAACGLKANIGHMEPAAGMGGLMGLHLALQSEIGAPNAQLRVLNEHVKGALAPVCVLPTAQAPVKLQEDIEVTAQKVGGVSSFGYAGTIAHSMLQHKRNFGGVVNDEIARPGTGAARMPQRRRAFPWRELASPVDAACTSVYVYKRLH